MTRLAGFRNSMDLVLTGLDIRAKADVLLQAAAGVTLEQAETLDPEALAHASKWDVQQLSVRLFTPEPSAPSSLASTQSRMRITVTDADLAKVGKPVTSALIEVGLSNYPGFYAEQPPGKGSPLVVLWPTTVSRSAVAEVVTIDGADVGFDATALHGAAESDPIEAASEIPDWKADSSTTQVPLGVLFGARSGDKGGTANIGVWVPDPTEPAAVEMAFGGAAAWAPAVDTWHDTDALWQADTPIPTSAQDAARADRMYSWLLAYLTPQRVRELLSDVVASDVIVHRLPRLRALNIELPQALGRGVTESTSLDPQAKSLGEYLRAKLVELPTEFLPGNGQG